MDNQATQVSFSTSDAIAIVQALGNAAIAINPSVAGGVAAITGIAELLRGTILPAVSHFQSRELTIAEQATLAAESAAERARVGAPPAPSN